MPAFSLSDALCLYVPVQRHGLCFPAVTEADLKRLREAAKRLGNASGTVSRQTFFHDVLGDNVPASQAEVSDLTAYTRVRTGSGTGK